MTTGYRSTRQRTIWLNQLEMLANMPYSGPLLVPAVVAEMRKGVEADFGAFGWVEGPHLQPVAFWSERMNEPVLRWLSDHWQEFFAEISLRAHLESDGDLVRRFTVAPDYESHWHYTQIMQPQGMRWAAGVPLLDAAGACQGFLYLFRQAEAGPFTDEEQTWLRRARDRLTGLGSGETGDPPRVLARAVERASLHLDRHGRILERSAQAIHLLYLCHERRMDLLSWAAWDLSALPEPARTLVAELVAHPAAGDRASCSLNSQAGRFDFRAERLQNRRGSGGRILVNISHAEPRDLSVARRLADWSLAPQEKRLLIASARNLDQRELAEALGVKVGTLKMYINQLKAKLEIESREAFIGQLLAERPPDH